MASKIICYGEVLWDVFPGGETPGGAPMNVAYHLKQMGVESHMISRVGPDDAGRRIVTQMEDWGIITTSCQTDSDYPTGRAIPMSDDDHEVTYDLLFPTAWDFIRWDTKYAALLSTATALVYGSLAARNETSRKTLLGLLDASNYNVLDVNLRAPYYSVETVYTLLEKSQLLKVNQAELDLICGWIGDVPSEEVKKAALLQERFLVQEIIVTKGSRGASYYAKEKQMHALAPKVQVIDTVGSGDAFLAGFLASKFSHVGDIARQLAYGNALGALVAGKSGACPPYGQKELHMLLDVLGDSSKGGRQPEGKVTGEG